MLSTLDKIASQSIQWAMDNHDAANPDSYHDLRYKKFASLIIQQFSIILEQNPNLTATQLIDQVQQQLLSN